jgi:hypothetical protein
MRVVFLVGKSEEERAHGIVRRRWEEIMGMDFFKKSLGRPWTVMIKTSNRDRWRAVVSAVMSFRVP